MLRYQNTDSFGLQPVVPRTTCSCQGINVGIPMKFGAHYGLWCRNWDKENCNEWWDPSPDKTLTLQKVQPGTWCCEHWCYVDKDCPDAKPSYLVYGLFFSYKSCEDDVSDIYRCKQPEVGSRIERQNVEETSAISWNPWFTIVFAAGIHI